MSTPIKSLVSAIVLMGWLTGCAGPDGEQNYRVLEDEPPTMGSDEEASPVRRELHNDPTPSPSPRGDSGERAPEVEPDAATAEGSGPGELLPPPAQGPGDEALAQKDSQATTAPKPQQAAEPSAKEPKESRPRLFTDPDPQPQTPAQPDKPEAPVPAPAPAPAPEPAPLPEPAPSQPRLPDVAPADVETPDEPGDVEAPPPAPDAPDAPTPPAPAVADAATPSLRGLDRSHWRKMTVQPVDGTVYHNPVYFNDVLLGHDDEDVLDRPDVESRINAAFAEAEPEFYSPRNAVGLVLQPAKYGFDLLTVIPEQLAHPLWSRAHTPDAQEEWLVDREQKDTSTTEKQTPKATKSDSAEEQAPKDQGYEPDEKDEPIPAAEVEVSPEELVAPPAEAESSPQ